MSNFLFLEAGSENLQITSKYVIRLSTFRRSKLRNKWEAIKLTQIICIDTSDFAS